MLEHLLAQSVLIWT